MRIVLVVLFFFTLPVSGGLRAQTWSLSSPDKKIIVRISNAAKLSYTVHYDRRKVIGDSPLGLELDHQIFSSNLNFLRQQKRTIDEKYSLTVGKRLQAHNYSNELTLIFEGVTKHQIQLVVRACNDGMAFRYHIPGSDGAEHVVNKEYSGFAIPSPAKAWIQAYDLNSRLKPCYETYYENGISPGTASPNPAGWAFPALFKISNVWMLISEAALDETYCASHLEDKESKGVYTIRFPEKEEVTSAADPEPVSTLPWTTPWRVALIGQSPATILNSTLITDLNPPSTIKDASWIKPGRSSWSWWSQGATPRDYDVQKEYIDFNDEMGWEYVLIDAGWPEMKNGKMEDLVRYASSKGVGIVLWYHSGVGREKDTLSMANLMAFPESRKREFQKLQAWGVKGVKVDFFDSDKQPVIKRYFEILRDAADHRIMVNFHGSTLPRGWERTFPHLVSMESVKGAEGYGRQEFCDRAPSHNTILPFTRNVVGSMDYTPVTFTNKREAIRQTTFGHELALSIVFESGVLHLADRMSSYQALPDEPKNFLKQVPVVWDETKYLAGDPGRYVVIARRKNNQWYIAGINGQEVGQEILFRLPPSGESGMLEVITDGPDAGTFATKVLKPVGRDLKIKLQPKGGFVGLVE